MKARELRPCGTEAAYRRHKRNGDDKCDACRDAHAAYEREQYERRTVRAA